MWAIRNIPEETIPWEIIINMAPIIPIVVFVIILRAIVFMWTIDEWAISFLMSIEFRHTSLITKDPQRFVDRIKVVMLFSTKVDRAVIFISPYPPSFRRMPANTMDPETGASTWAFGSHKWTSQHGSFTKKAV